MPIDASIPLGVRQIELPNQLAQFAQAQQIQGMQQRNRLVDLQFQEAERENAAKLAVGEAYRSNIGADGTLNRQGLIGNLAQSGQGAMIPGIQKTFSEQDKSQREAEKARLEQAGQQISLIGQVAGSANDPQSYAAGRARLQAAGVDVSQIPEQYDPNYVAGARQQALTAAQQLEQVWKQKGYDLDQQKFGYQQQNDQANRGVTIRGQDVAASTAMRGQDITMRGQNMVDARSRQAEGKGQIVQGPDGPILVDPRTGRTTPITDSTGQSLEAPKIAAEKNARTRDATEVLALLDQATPLLDQSTGSYLGVGADALARGAGFSTSGANAAAQLKALEGALISKMPKMSGPQSDKDVALYRQMAGEIGDATVPASRKKAAMQTIRQINERQLGNSGRSGSWQDTGAPATPRAAPVQSGPAVGSVQGGYRFRGGNPADQANWERM